MDRGRMDEGGTASVALCVHVGRGESSVVGVLVAILVQVKKA